MRVPTAPRRRRGLRVRGWIIAGVILLVILLFSLRGLAGFYTDFLWFDSVGQGGTWRELLSAKVVPALVFTLVFFVIMLTNLLIADRLAPKYRSMGPEDELVERYQQFVSSYQGRIRVGVSLFFALIAGVGVSSQWQEWVLFTHRVDFGVKDAQFNQDIGFYVFQLPFLRFIANWLFAGLVIVLLVTAVAHYLNGGIRFQSPFQRVTPQVKAHLSVILAVMALVKTAQYYLDRFKLDFSHTGRRHRGQLHGREGAAAGAEPADLHLDRGRGAVHLEHLAARMGAPDHRRRLVGVRVDRHRHDLPGRSPKVPGGAERVPEGAALHRAQHRGDASGVQPRRCREQAVRLSAEPRRPTTVEPECCPIEQRAAVGSGSDSGDIPDTSGPSDLLQDRRRRHRSLQDRRIRRAQVVLAAREINSNELPSKSWVNTHLVYTHGYGVVAAADERVRPRRARRSCSARSPSRQDAPITLNQPRSLLRRATSRGFVLVDAKQTRVRLSRPRAQTDATTRYKGKDGVELSNSLRRAAFALRFGDINLLISGQVGRGTKVMYVRDIKDRVKKLAPFLDFDADPYPVVIGGRSIWVLDGTPRRPLPVLADDDGGRATAVSATSSTTCATR